MAITLRTFLFGLVLVGLFTSISIAYVTNLKDSYSVTTSAEFDSTLSAMNQTSQDMWEAKTSFSDASQKITEGSILGGAISGATGVVEILKLPFTTMGS